MDKIKQESILNSLNIRGLRKVSDTKYECYCTDEGCGNFQNEKRRKAGFFWSNSKSEYVYHCFKCGRAKGFKSFIKTYFKNEYLNVFFSRDSIQEKKEAETVKISDEIIKDYIEFLMNENILARLDKCKIPEVIEYIQNRKLPESKLKYLYYIENYNDMRKQLKELKGEEKFENSEGTDRRIVWFFKDRTSRILGMQGRTIEDKVPRYMIDRIEGDGKLIGGFERADFSQRLYVVEGYIDSLFLPNCVSLNGLHLPTIRYLLSKCNVQNMTIIFDNEPMNQQIQKNINELVEMTYKYEGLKVCLLPKEMRKFGKDINDYIKSGISSDSIIDIINNNSYSKAGLKVNSVFWR